MLASLAETRRWLVTVGLQVTTSNSTHINITINSDGLINSLYYFGPYNLAKNWSWAWDVMTETKTLTIFVVTSYVSRPRGTETARSRPQPWFLSVLNDRVCSRWCHFITASMLTRLPIQSTSKQTNLSSTEWSTCCSVLERRWSPLPASRYSWSPRPDPAKNAVFRRLTGAVFFRHSISSDTPWRSTAAPWQDSSIVRLPL